MAQTYYCQSCSKSHRRTSAVGEAHAWFERRDGLADYMAARLVRDVERYLAFWAIVEGVA